MSINQKQNLDSQIEMLAAQRNLYSSAKTVIGTQMILAGPVAVIATLLAIYCPDLKNYVALWGITVLVLDQVILSPYQKKLRGLGALVQEAFDSKVLNIEWNGIKVGAGPEPELIHEQAQKFGKDAEKLDELKNWYPVAVQQLPESWGSIICQRTNVWWDSKLRRRYANTVLIILILLAIGLIWFAFSQSLNFTDFVMKMVIPMAALYRLGVTQFIEHRDAADRLDKLKDHAETLWSDAIKGASIEVLKVNSRRLQDEIYEGRKRNPPVFDAIFKIFRNDHEDQMNKGAMAFIQEATEKINQHTTHGSENE